MVAVLLLFSSFLFFCWNEKKNLLKNIIYTIFIVISLNITALDLLFVIIIKFSRHIIITHISISSLLLKCSFYEPLLSLQFCVCLPFGFGLAIEYSFFSFLWYFIFFYIVMFSRRSVGVAFNAHFREKCSLNKFEMTVTFLPWTWSKHIKYTQTWDFIGEK